MKASVSKRETRRRIRKSGQLYLIMLPAFLATALFSYVPMYGIVLAFQKYNPTKSMFNQKFVGMRYFEKLFGMKDFYQILTNTLVIALMKIVSLLLFSLLLALLLNELRSRPVKGAVQGMLIFPHFLSWIILGGLVKEVFAKYGIVNQALLALGLPEPVYFMGDKTWFRVILIVSNLWQEAGFSAILYSAAITGIDPSLYEAAKIDGANRLQQTWHVTLKGIMPFVVLLAILNLGNVLNAGFDQVFNLMNGVVIETADIIDTYAYRVGLLGGQYSFGTTVGLFKSAVSCVLIGISYWIADRRLGYRVF